MWEPRVDQFTAAIAEPRLSRVVEATAEWIEVLVDCPGAQGLFVYAVPAELTMQPGDILSVPFGSQQVGAIAIRFLAQLPPELDPTQVKCVEEVVSTGFFPPTYWTLLERVAYYYGTSLMAVVRVALPPGLLGRSQRRVRLQPQRCDPAREATLSPVAQQILTRLQAQKQGSYTWQYLQQQIPGANRGLRELLQQGWVESYLEPPTPVKPKLRQAVTLVAAPEADMGLSARQI